jgi:hypothetical protein
MLTLINEMADVWPLQQHCLVRLLPKHCLIMFIHMTVNTVPSYLNKLHVVRICNALNSARACSTLFWIVCKSTEVYATWSTCIFKLRFIFDLVHAISLDVQWLKIQTHNWKLIPLLKPDCVKEETGFPHVSLYTFTASYPQTFQIKCTDLNEILILCHMLFIFIRRAFFEKIYRTSRFW